MLANGKMNGSRANSLCREAKNVRIKPIFKDITITKEA